MNDLEVIDKEQVEEPYKSGSVQYIDSREVAEIIEKEHKNLLRDVKRYDKELGELKIEPSSFWVESSYINSQNKIQPCYLFTKKGCEFIAHKLTGIKGTKFTATYINRFHEMEDTLQTQMLPTFQKFMEQQTEINRSQAEILTHQQNTMLQILNRLESLGQQSKPVQHERFIEFGNSPFGLLSMRSSPFPASDQRSERRLDELNELIAKVSSMYDFERNKVLHHLYNTVSADLGISLNSYLEFYRKRTGQEDACALHVIAAYELLYGEAIEVLEDAIERKKIFAMC